MQERILQLCKLTGKLKYRENTKLITSVPPVYKLFFKDTGNERTYEDFSSHVYLIFRVYNPLEELHTTKKYKCDLLTHYISVMFASCSINWYYCTKGAIISTFVIQMRINFHHVFHICDATWDLWLLIKPISQLLAIITKVMMLDASLQEFKGA